MTRNLRLLTGVVMLVALGSIAVRSATAEQSAPRTIGAVVMLKSDGLFHGTFACNDQNTLFEAFAIFRQRFSEGMPDKVRRTPEAQRYLEIGCVPISRDDGPMFVLSAYDVVDQVLNCRIESWSIKRPAWVRCIYLQTKTGEALRTPTGELVLEASK
jgi:hypothetical protein